MVKSVSDSAGLPVIELIDVAVASARAPEIILIQGIHWTICASEYWVVAGLPGAGKSDLFAVAAGVQRPAHGTHRLFGKDIAGLSEEALLRERLGIGMVFESGGRLFNHLTVAENIGLPLCYHHNCTPQETREQLEAMLEITGLTSVANDFPRQIKRSLRQRVGLARALVLKPRVLLVENLLVGLELRQMDWWREFLARLSAGHEIMDLQPMTLVVATHDLQPWMGHGKQFVLLKEHRLLPLGGRDAVAASEEPLLQELRTAEAPAG